MQEEPWGCKVTFEPEHYVWDDELDNDKYVPALRTGGCDCCTEVTPIADIPTEELLELRNRAKHAFRELDRLYGERIGAD